MNSASLKLSAKSRITQKSQERLAVKRTMKIPSVLLLPGYWRRVWIVQEVVFAAQACVMARKATMLLQTGEDYLGGRSEWGACMSFSIRDRNQVCDPTG